MLLKVLINTDSERLFGLIIFICFVLLQTPEEEEVLNKKRSKKTQKKYDERKKTAKISTLLEEQFQQGKLLGESEFVSHM